MFKNYRAVQISFYSIIDDRNIAVSQTDSKLGSYLDEKQNFRSIHVAGMLEWISASTRKNNIAYVILPVSCER